MTKRTPHHYRRRGNALVEGALVMTAFMMILFGIIDFSRAVFMYNTAQFAAREGARWASVRGSTAGTVDGVSQVATADSVRNYSKSLMPGVPSADITVTTAWDPNNQPGSTVTVTVVAKFTPLTPYMQSGQWDLQGISRLMISQ